MKRFRIVCVFFVLFLGLYGGAVAQAPIASILTAAHVAAQRYPDADAIYLTNEETARIDQDGTVHLSIHRTILLLNQTGIDQYGTLQLAYVPPVQEAKLDYARTIFSDGKQAVPDATAISDQQLGDWSNYASCEIEEARPFNVYSIAMPEVTVGAVVDWQVTVTGKDPYVPGTFSKVWPLASEVPMVEVHYQVQVPRDMPLRWAITKTDLQPEIQTASDTTTYIFRMHDVSRIAYNVIGMPAISALSPAVFVSTVGSCNEIAKAYKQEFDSSAQLDQVVIRKAKGLTVGCTSNKVKIDRIYRFVANHIFASSSPHLLPSHANTTLFIGYGDCKDQTALLIALLKAAGITAYPVLLNSDLGMDVDLDLPPTPELFNHAIVAIPSDDGWRFLDPINGSHYLSPYLPDQDTDKHAMLVLGEQDRLWIEVLTPASTPDASQIKTTAEMTLYKGGDITLQATSKLTGAPSAVIDSLVSSYETDAIKDYYQQILAKDLPNAKIVSFDPYVFSLDDPYPVVTNFSITIRTDGAVDMTKDSSTISLPYPPPIGGGIATADLDLSRRTYPFFISPQRIVLSTFIHLPHGWKAVLPAQVHVENEIGSFTSSYQEISSNAISTTYLCDRTLQLDVMKVSVEKMPLLKAIVDALQRNQTTKIEIRREETSSP